MESTSYRSGHFPPQKLSGKKKTKKWYTDCIEAAEQLSFVGDHRIRQSWKNKKANYDLANDKLDMADVKRITNPFNIEGLSIPAKLQNHGVSMAKIDLLIGEEAKRRFDYFIRITNDDAVSQKEKDLRAKIDETLVEIISQGQPDEETFKRKMDELNKFKNYDYQDLRERRATQLLKYLEKKEDIKDKLSKCFLNLLISGEELGVIDIVSGEPVFNVVNPLDLHVVSSGDSPYLEDADIVIEDKYYPPGKVIDMFHDELTDAEVKRIMDGDLSRGAGGSKFALGGKERSVIPSGQFEIVVDPETGITEESEVGDGGRGYRGSFDLDGNVRVMRVVWRGIKALYKVKYQDPETGEMEEDLMPEDYKPLPGEDAKKIWINEWYEGTMIGTQKESIKIKYGPRPIQFRELDNPSKCYSGYVGTFMNINDSRSYSLMDRMKPLQYLYNVYMYRTEQAFAKSYGKILQLPFHMVPDNWDLDQWLGYMFQMNVMVTDAFKEGDKGAAQGKLAGTMNTQTLVADMEQGNYIQQNIMMLEFIKREMGEIVGITEQRQGQIETRELVGNVQRAVTQSSHITEKWFQAHDNFKRRVLQMLLETAKYAYRDQKLKRQLILDDLTSQIFDIDGDELMECDHGIFVSNSTQDTELFDQLKALSQAALQNDKLSFTQLMDIYSTDSMSSIKRKIENAEMEKAQQQQDMEQRAIEMQQQVAQMQQAVEQAKLDIEESNNIRDNQTRLLVEEMKLRAQNMINNEGENNSKLALELKKHKDQLELKEQELKDKMKMHSDKMKREDRKISKMRTTPVKK